MWFYVLSLAIVILDQLSKSWMSRVLTLCEPGHCDSIRVLPFFSLTLLHNQGAAFSFLNDAGGWQRGVLVFISSSVSLVVGVWMYRIRRQHRLLALALAFILGGAVGNLIDRAATGYVVDFLLFHYGDWAFPAFNVADSAITVGAGLLVLDMLLKPGTIEQTGG